MLLYCPSFPNIDFDCDDNCIFIFPGYDKEQFKLQAQVKKKYFITHRDLLLKERLSMITFRDTESKHGGLDLPLPEKFIIRKILPNTGSQAEVSCIQVGQDGKA